MTEEVPSSTPDNLDRAAEAAAPAASATPTETVWIIGDLQPDSAEWTSDAAQGHHPLMADLLLAATVSSEVPPNLEHALDQLTTATDLFDVPVLDYLTPSSDI